MTMTLEINRKNDVGPSTILARHEFDALSPLPNCSLELVPASFADASEAFHIAREKIGGDLAPVKVIESAIGANSHNITLFRKNGHTAGMVALLMLSPRGLENLLIGEIDLLDPARENLSATADVPAAIYVWAIVSPGAASEGIRLMSSRLRQPQFAKANLYSRAATDAGRRIICATGFQPVPNSALSLFRYVRSANRSNHFAKAA